MTARVDLRGLDAAGRLRQERAFSDLAALAAAIPGDRLEVVADGEDAFAARLAVGAETLVVRQPGTRPSRRSYRPAGEANPAPVEGSVTLVEPFDLRRIAESEQGPADADRQRDDRLRELAADDGVVWRVAADWQAQVLRRSLTVPDRRILRMPAEAALPAGERLGSVRLPRELPPGHLLCLTPVGDAGDFVALVAAHARLGPGAAPLVVLGVDDERWVPVVRDAVGSAGSRGRVLLLRDLDPVSTAAAIARASAVVAIDRHPAHAVRLRQAAELGKPAAVRRHPGHAAWVTGCCWFADGGEELAAALAEPAPMRSRPAAAATSLAAWLAG